MPPGLLQSQFAALEEPGNALTVGIDRPPAAIVEAIRAALGV
jgi:gluconokinase